MWRFKRSRKTPEFEPPPQTVVPHVLCDCCSRIVKKSKIIQAFAAGQDINNIIDSSSEWFLHNRNFDLYVSKSSATACHLCSLAVAQYDLSPPAYGRSYVSFVSASASNAMANLRVIFEIHYVPSLMLSGDLMTQVMKDFDYMDKVPRTPGFQPGGYFTELQLTRCVSEGRREAGCLVAETLDTNATSIRGPLSSTSTNSPESTLTARAWIDDCLRNHPKCSRKPFDTNNTDYGQLPTRLIDIETVDGKLAPRLILTSTSENKSIQYLTLSHSWAVTSTDSALKLTGRNLELLQMHIPIEGLPRTFQDALEITRQLGYRYLWIDSLCIMQDSESDWHREALTMSSIYGNSSCNIAALGVDGADTCFRQRNPLQALPCQIAQQEDGTSVFADRGLELNTPLLRRGWVLQERLLSPRVLYTGASRLFWECCSRTASEGLPSLGGEQLLQPEHACVWVGYLNSEKYCTKSDFELLCGYEAPRPESDKIPSGLPCGTQDPLLTFAQAWLRIVRGYQRTEFTYESDRLIALSGVAKTIEYGKGFTYVAGTWKELWPLDLLWWYHERDPSKEEPTDFTKSKPPSWSWAARKWAKEFLLLERFGFDIPLITYRAQFKYFTCPTSTARYTGTRADKEGIILTIKSRVKRGLAAWKWRFKCSLLAVRASDTEWVYVYWDPGQIPKLGESVLLLILISERTTNSTLFQAGLALMPEEDARKKDGQPCYRRVGYFEAGFQNHETWGEETIRLC